MPDAALLLRGRLAAIPAALLIAVAAALSAAAPPVHAQAETVRPEVGRPLQAAQELLKAQKYKEALAKIKDADAIQGKTPYESFIVERMRGAAAAGAGDTETAMKSFEAVIGSGRLPAPEQLKLIEALAGTAYRARDYTRAQSWAQRYLREGGTGGNMRALLAQADYLAGDYAGAAKELAVDIAAVEAAGNAPAEDRLQLLANCYLKLNDKVAYITTLEKLVAYHPKKEYWVDLLSRIQRKPGFANRLTLDVYRLMLATGNLKETSDFMEMAQLALQAGLPGEARKVVDDGYALGVLGSGADAARHKRLSDMANKQAAEDQKGLAASERQAGETRDGNALVALGYAYVASGQLEKGIALFEQGIAKGDLKRPEDAKLHLGIALLQAGNKAKAQRLLRSVQGSDGTADIARLWLLQGGRSL